MAAVTVAIHHMDPSARPRVSKYFDLSVIILHSGVQRSCTVLKILDAADAAANTDNG